LEKLAHSSDGRNSSFSRRRAEVPARCYETRLLIEGACVHGVISGGGSVARSCRVDWRDQTSPPTRAKFGRCRNQTPAAFSCGATMAQQCGDRGRDAPFDCGAL